MPTDVRLRLGRWGHGDTLLIERLTTRQRWTTSPAMAACVVAFTGGRRRSEGTAFLAHALGTNEAAVSQHLDSLTAAGLLTTTRPADDPLAAHWGRHGWRAAYDHHQATWGFPLVDYTADGWDTDRTVMARYRNALPDPGPLAHDRCADAPQAWDLTDAFHAELPAPLTSVLHNTEATAPLDASTLRTLVAKTFCFTQTRPGSKVRRTSPSGGARHPAEGYIITQDVPGMCDGIWHVAAAHQCLVNLPGDATPAWTRKHLDGLYMAPFTPQALIVVTAVFYRNMYRYREPRTFRTIFMDIGHLLGTCEMVAAALGLQSFIHHAINEDAVEELLDVEPLREGVIAGAAVAGSS